MSRRAARADAPPTEGRGSVGVERVFLIEPYRLTAHARVDFVSPDGVAFDRTIFAPKRGAYGHALPTDRGHVLVDGHKLKVQDVRLAMRSRRVIHRLGGPAPTVGATAIMHLDRDRRLLNMRAHAVAHLAEAALAARRAPPVTAGEVRGGGTVRVDAPWRSTPAERDAFVAELNARVAAAIPISAAYEARDTLLPRLVGAPNELAHAAPAEPSLRAIAIGVGDDVIARAPCEGCVVANTREIGRVSLIGATARHDSTRLILRVS